MLKKASFQKKIFISYSLLVIVIILILSVSFYVYISNVLREKTEAGMQQHVERISSQLDSLIREMDTISTQVFFNKEIQNIMSDALAYRDKGTNFFDMNPEIKLNANYALVSINSPKVIVRRISIFNNYQNFISIGTVGMQNDDYTTIKSNLRNITWAKRASKLGGEFIILSPHKDDWQNGNAAQMVISLARSLLATYSAYNNIGVVEIQQPYSMIEDICYTNQKSLRIMVIDKAGEAIYPYDKISKGEINYYNKISTLKEKNGLLLKRPTNNVQELIYAMQSQYTGWTVILAQPKRDFMASVNFIQKILYITGFLLIILTLLVINIVTKTLTAPIKEIRKSVKKLSLENLSINISNKAGNNELEQLNETFNETLKRLEESMHQTVQARSSEIHAHFLALQAQMNPHFLYNTLMGISTIAQEIGSRKIVSMCSQVSDMLRYIAAFDNPSVTINDEIRHAENYLKLVKWRYEDRLDYKFIIDENLYDIKVSKLIVQPIIENSFSHGFSSIKPPFKIILKGYIVENKWMLDINDNGSGFNEDTIKLLFEQMEQYKKNICSGKITNKLEVGGMGIINIYIRLYLLYGDNAVFTIKNNLDAGSSITLGGPIC